MQEIKCDENPVRGRICIRLSGKLTAPLLIGSGEAKESDMDVIVDEEGLAFIPGTSLAGSLRAYLKKILKRETLEDLFGGSRAGKTESGSPMYADSQSRLYVYDTCLKQPKLEKRDGVRLTETKTAQNQSKYDYQTVERETQFDMYLEIIQRQKQLEKEKGSTGEQLCAVQEKDLKHIKACVAGMIKGELRLGGKSRRGFGKVEICRMNIISFNLMNQGEYKEWLDWDFFSEGAFEKKGNPLYGEELRKLGKEMRKRQEHVLLIPLELTNTLLVRQYGRQVEQDCVTLLGRHKGKMTAIIPGTSWAGALRSRIAALLMPYMGQRSWQDAQELLAPFFGTWQAENRKKEGLLASRIIFEESAIEGGHGLPLTRNSIDRFTGGTVTGALFTEQVWYGGRTELIIRFPAQENQKEEEAFHPWLGLLLWAIEDLKNGLLSIGGEGGVGRGIFEGKGDMMLDGERLSNELLSQYQRAAAKWCKEQKEEWNAVAQR